MQAAMTAAKQTTALGKLATQAEEGTPPDYAGNYAHQQQLVPPGQQDGDEVMLDEATLEKLKANTYEKLAKSKGQTVDELKAAMKECSVSSQNPLLLDLPWRALPLLYS